MMSAAASYLRRFLRDSIFVRVCVSIYGALFCGFGAVLLSTFTPPQSLEWIAVAFGFVAGCFGLFMLYASVFGRLRLLEKASDGVVDGGEIIGLVLMAAVLLAAFPISVIIKFLRSLRRSS